MYNQDAEFNKHVTDTLRTVEEFGNSSEETRAAGIEAMGNLAIALAISKLADKLGGSSRIGFDPEFRTGA